MLSMVLYQEQRFLTHAIAREFLNSFSWMIDYLLATLLQQLLVSFLPKILLVTIAL